MKIIGINGSPRKNWNTSTLLHKALEGAASMGAETELVNLYDLKYRGCISCFACKKKGGNLGTCAMRDDLSPLLEALKVADAIVFGSPLYYMNISSGMIALLERFLYSNSIYSDDKPNLYPKKTASAFIYTMNITAEDMAELNGKTYLSFYQEMLTERLGVAPKLLYSHFTYQFSDYKLYESPLSSEPGRAKQREEQFPLDCEAAYQMGKELINI